MAYLGLVPSENSSGGSVRRGAITKTGNGYARRALIEAAQAYSHPAHQPRDPQAPRSRAGTDSANRLESAAAALRTVPKIDRSGQESQPRGDRYCPRAVRFHVGDRQTRPGAAGLKRSLSKNKTAKGAKRTNQQNSFKAYAGTGPRSGEPSSPLWNRPPCPTSALRARRLRDEDKSCVSTREYQSDQTSLNWSRFCLCFEFIFRKRPQKKGQEILFAIDNCQPYQMSVQN